MSSCIPSSQVLFNQTPNFLSENLENRPQSANPLNTLNDSDSRTSAKALYQALEIFHGNEQGTKWSALEAFFYRFIKDCGISHGEVLNLINNGDVQKGAWLSLCEELKQSTRLISGVGRFFKLPLQETDFLTLIAYTLFNPLTRHNQPELIKRLSAIFKKETCMDLIKFFSQKHHPNFLLATSYLQLFKIDHWDSIDEFEGLTHLYYLFEDISPIQAEEQEKVDNVLSFLRNSPYHTHFLRDLQTHPEFYERVKTTTKTFLSTGRDNIDLILAEILKMSYRFDGPQESRELVVWLLDIASRFSPNLDLIFPKIDPLLSTLQSLNKEFSLLSPESLKITIKIYGPLLLSPDGSPMQKEQRFLANNLKLTSLFANITKAVQECGNSLETEEIHYAVSSSLSRFYHRHGEEASDRLFEDFFRDLVKYPVPQRYILFTLKIFPTFAEGVDDYDIADRLFNSLYSFVLRSSTQFLEMDLLESELLKEIDHLNNFFPNHKTNLIEAGSFVLATYTKLSPKYLDKNLKLLNQISSLFRRNNTENFAEFIKIIESIKSNMRNKFLRSIQDKVETSLKMQNPPNSTDKKIESLERSLINCSREKAMWFCKITTELLPIPQAKIPLVLFESILSLFADNNASSSFCAFYDILRKKQESDRIELIYRFVEFTEPFKINLTPESLLALFFAISNIKDDPKTVLEILKLQLTTKDQESEKQVKWFFQNLSLMPLEEWILFLSIQPIQNLSLKTVITHAQKTEPFRDRLLEHLPQVYWQPYHSLANATAHLALEICDHLNLDAEDPIRSDVTEIQAMLVDAPEEKNPYFVYRACLANVAAPFEPMPTPPSYFIGKENPIEITWNQKTLHEKGQVKTWFAASLPQGLSQSVEKFAAIFNRLQTRINTLPPREKKEIEAHIASLSSFKEDEQFTEENQALEKLTTKFLNSSILKGYMSRYAESIAGDPHAAVKEGLVQFTFIAKKILDTSPLISETELLNDQEAILIKFATMLTTCITGQDEGLSRFFNSAFQGTERVITLYANDTDALFSKIVDESVQSEIHYLLEDYSFICNLAGAEKVGELSHQTQYLKARWHRMIGLRHGALPFDRNSFLLHEGIVKVQNDAFQKAFFKFFTPDNVIKHIQKASEGFKENAELYNKFIELLDNQGILPPDSEAEEQMELLEKSIVLDKEKLTPLGLTEFGAIKALEALKYVTVKDPCKRPLSFGPNPLEPPAKRTRNEKIEID